VTHLGAAALYGMVRETLNVYGERGLNVNGSN